MNNVDMTISVPIHLFEFVFSVLLDIYPEMELLYHTVIIFL